jgi:hypothetical protein
MKHIVLCIALLISAPYLVPESIPAGLAASTTRQPTYTEKTTGLTFSYPAGAKLEETPDKDTLIRISGEYPTAGHGFMVTVNKVEVQPGTDPETLSRLLEEKSFSALKDSTLLSHEQKYLGTRSQFHGVVDTVRFSNGKDVMCQKWAFFKDPQAGGQLRVMTIVTKATDIANLDRLFSDVFTTLNHSVAEASPVTPRAFATATVEGISFHHPSEWNAVRNPDRDTLIKVSGPSSEVRIGALPLDVNISSDQMQKMIEDEFLSHLTDVKKLTDANVTYGGRLAGQKSTYNFDMEGHRCFGTLFIFSNRNKLYAMQLTNFGLDQAAAQKLFEDILSSLNAR